MSLKSCRASRVQSLLNSTISSKNKIKITTSSVSLLSTPDIPFSPPGSSYHVLISIPSSTSFPTPLLFLSVLLPLPCSMPHETVSNYLPSSSILLYPIPIPLPMKPHAFYLMNEVMTTSRGPLQWRLPHHNY